MRIISQNGDCNLPYDRIILSFFNMGEGITLIYAQDTVSDISKGVMLARYSTEEKAEKAMNLLYRSSRRLFKKNIFKFPQESDI